MMKTLVNKLAVAGAASLAALLLSSGGVLGELVISEPVRSVDNIPPEPVTTLLAVDTGVGVRITWDLSIDDAVSFTTFGGAIVPRGGVQGYRVYRAADNAPQELISALGPGVGEFDDLDVLSGVAYSYSVHPFDLDNETGLDLLLGSPEDLARVVLLDGGTLDLVEVTTVRASITFDQDLAPDQEAIDTFVESFVALLSDLLGIDPSRISVTAVRSGSTIVDFVISAPPQGSSEAPAEAVLTDLIELVRDDAVNEFESLGTVAGIVDRTSTDIVAVPQPVDGSGNLVLGWFTRQGDRVGLTDFFLFADHFGLSEGEDDYDSRFDIVANGIVDLLDFFRFADDFGTVVANAAEIQDLLGL